VHAREYQALQRLTRWTWRVATSNDDVSVETMAPLLHLIIVLNSSLRMRLKSRLQFCAGSDAAACAYLGRLGFAASRLAESERRWSATQYPQRDASLKRLRSGAVSVLLL